MWPRGVRELSEGAQKGGELVATPACTLREATSPGPLPITPHSLFLLLMNPGLALKSPSGVMGLWPLQRKNSGLIQVQRVLFVLQLV